MLTRSVMKEFFQSTKSSVLHDKRKKRVLFKIRVDVWRRSDNLPEDRAKRAGLGRPRKRNARPEDGHTRNTGTHPGDPTKEQGTDDSYFFQLVLLLHTKIFSFHVLETKHSSTCPISVLSYIS